MSLICLESFDLIGSLNAKGWNSLGGSTGRIWSPGRTGPHHFEVQAGSIFKIFYGEESPTYTIGAAIIYNGPDAGGTYVGAYVFRLGNDSQYVTSDWFDTYTGPDISWLANLWINYDGVCVIQCGNVTAYSSIPIIFGNWTYLEFSVTLGPDGSVALDVNGVPAIRQSVDTDNGVFNIIKLGNQISPNAYVYNSTMIYDDLYVTNGEGSCNTGMLGDIAVVAILPNGVGDKSDLTNSDGTSLNNYEYVNSGDQMVTFVESNNPGDEDTYHMSSLSYQSSFGIADHRGYNAETPLILGNDIPICGVQVLVLAEKNNTGNRSIIPLVRENGTDHLSTDAALSFGATLFHSQIFEKDPDTGKMWTVDTVNKAQIGVRVE